MAIYTGLPQGFSASSYDAVVVGAGLAGSVCARELAEQLHWHVAVLERRAFVAGNAYDHVDDAGILIHEYGPHIYHTTSARVHEYLSRFTEWLDYQHKVLANVHGTLMPVPFNHTSLKLAFGETRGEKLYLKLVEAFGQDCKVPIMELREQPDRDLHELADYVYENIFLHYSMKQWGKAPDEIDPSVTGRVPVFIGDDDRYFPQAPYQGMPKYGYTALVENMLTLEGIDEGGIDVFLEVDALDLLDVSGDCVCIGGSPYGGTVIYTGAIDELFGADLGHLPYRTLDMQFETLPQDSFQPVATVNYTTSEDFTRITEFKHMTGQVKDGITTIMREYPLAYQPGTGQTPYYAIIEQENIALYESYRERARSLNNLLLVGRLAEYRYYDMDGVVDSALKLAQEIITNT